MNKPVNLVLPILNISKTVMYKFLFEFSYDYLLFT